VSFHTNQVIWSDLPTRSDFFTTARQDISPGIPKDCPQTRLEFPIYDNLS